MGGGQPLSQRPSRRSDEALMRRREPGDKRKQRGFCRSSRYGGLGAQLRSAHDSKIRSDAFS